MSFRQFLKHDRRGAILPFIVLIVLLMFVIGLSVTGLGMHGRLFAIRSASRITARSAADASISDAVFEMNEKIKIKPWDNSTLPAKSDILLTDPEAAASFDYAVTDNNGIYSVEGTGRAGVSVHTINTTLRLYSPFDWAMLTKGNIEMKNTAQVDWINYQADDFPARIGTLRTAPTSILLMNGSTINGDAFVGVSGNPDVVITSKANVEIKGGTYPLSYEPPLPEIRIDPSVEIAPLQDNIDTTRTISASGRYKKLILGNGEELTIDEPVTLYLTEGVEMGNNTEIIIGGDSDTDGDASLKLYVAKGFDAGNSNGFSNNTADARRLQLFCLPSCTIVRLKNSGNFYGAIYAPYADITLDNGADVYGSIIGNSFILKNGGTFFYDANLRDRSIYDDLVRFTTNRWSED